MTALVDEHPHLGVEPVLRELNIPSSTYYRWRQAETEPCERHRRDAELTSRIRQVHDESGGIYGSPRVHAVLKREGVHVGRKRVERLMRQAGLAGISPRRGKSFTRRDPDADLAPDLVQRHFTASGPNRLWVTDLTMIATLEGPLWLSAIRDAFSRRVVAWETSARADADLVLTTLSSLASRSLDQAFRPVSVSLLKAASKLSAAALSALDPIAPMLCRIPADLQISAKARLVYWASSTSCCNTGLLQRA
ncbi:IS3 family transposase [Streptomyces sp. NPDC058622]|uniref:IS3 family transposase n=1 Tax=Streptomyces sp. NPDC058622 TaxID=3346562 RepID=UPI003664D49D